MVFLAKIAKFTDVELELLETFADLIEAGYDDPQKIYKMAASRLKIAESTVRSRVSRMKTKYESLMSFAGDYRGWQQKFFQRTRGQFNPLSRRGNKK